jgi:hypothetical protein
MKEKVQVARMARKATSQLLGMVVAAWQRLRLLRGQSVPLKRRSYQL